MLLFLVLFLSTFFSLTIYDFFNDKNFDKKKKEWLSVSFVFALLLTLISSAILTSTLKSHWRLTKKDIIQEGKFKKTVKYYQKVLSNKTLQENAGLFIFVFFDDDSDKQKRIEIEFFDNDSTYVFSTIMLGESIDEEESFFIKIKEDEK